MAIRGRNTRMLTSIRIVPRKIMSTVKKCNETMEKSRNREGPMKYCKENAVVVNSIPAPIVYFHEVNENFGEDLGFRIRV
jgi:hypothetical protein